jgi:hypothetical protein
MTTDWDESAAGRRRLTLSIAHDLGYVMSAIASQAERLLEDTAADSPRRRHVHAIRRATAFGERLARELMDADEWSTFPSAHADGAVGAEPPSSPSPRASRGPAVLVIVEEAGVRELIVEILELHDFFALPARDHREAERLSAAHSGSLALVLADTPPGTYAARRVDGLRRSRPEARLLYLSDADGQQTLATPFSVDALVRKVREVLTEPTG